MSYKLVKNLTTVNYTKGNKGRKYIVIHYTGNSTDTAAANGNYFKSVNRGASAHYFVDRTQVVQVVDDANTAWAVGKNYGSNNMFGTVTNANSISIEMCSTGGKIADETYDNTVALTKSLMKKYGIPASRVVRHWDVCSKVCPGWSGWGANGKDASIWNQFKKDIQSSSTSSSQSATKVNASSDHGGTPGHYWATIQLETFDKSNGQRWIVHKHSDGTYSIKNVASTIYMSVRDGKMSDNQEVWAYSWNDTKSQRFKLDTQDLNEFASCTYIKCVNNNNMLVQVKDASTKSGAGVCIKTKSGAYAQRWVFIPTGLKEEYYILVYGCANALGVKYK